MFDIPFQYFVSLGLILVASLVVYLIINIIERAVIRRYRIDQENNLSARKILTQVKLLKKIALVFLFILTGAAILMVFDSVRQIGTSIIASAGVIGIIVGFAAQKSISMILAGFQIALTQPIRLDDVVIVEGEWGKIEELTLTYVVVKIWDQRRLVLPINYFIEKPFQNWTRTGSDILGTVFLNVDYSMPLEPLREEFDRIMENSALWNKKAKVIQVTDIKERTVELRALVSANDAGAAWNLRCEVREKLLDFVQKNYPQCLPKTRESIEPVVVNKSASSKKIAELV
ncbi:MAG: mechanosensitive ion channel family protein [Candidatus Paceibacterota bacterium]